MNTSSLQTPPKSDAPSPWVPRPEEEETLFSYFTRVWLLAGRPNEKKLLSKLFGPGHPSLERVCFDGIGSGKYLEACLRPSGYIFVRGAYEEHSLRALAKPFRAEHEDARPKNAIAPRDLIAYQMLGIAKTRFKPNPEFCPVCVQEDRERLGFSYWRRTPQVVGSNYCAKHKTGLIDRCIACGEFNSIYRLPDLSCYQCDATLISLHPYQDVVHTQLQFAFAMAVERIYRGAITGPLSNSHAINLFETKVSDPKPPLGSELSRYIEYVAGSEYLKELGLHYTKNDKFPWPTLFYSDKLVFANASHQLLIHAVLTFDQPERDLWQRSQPPEHRFIDNIDQGFKYLWRELATKKQKEKSSAPC